MLSGPRPNAAFCAKRACGARCEAALVDRFPGEAERLHADRVHPPRAVHSSAEQFPLRRHRCGRAILWCSKFQGLKICVRAYAANWDRGQVRLQRFDEAWGQAPRPLGELARNQRAPIAGKLAALLVGPLALAPSTPTPGQSPKRGQLRRPAFFPFFPIFPSGNHLETCLLLGFEVEGCTTRECWLGAYRILRL